MAEIKVVPLGAGQDVGRSCILVSIGTKNIMFDCGMHMGYNNEKRFPDFTYISKNKCMDEFIDCLIISHFHLDHCGALPYFTEMVGYNGPIYMTQPTKAICPILLEDFRKITVDKRGDQNFFTQEMIQKCMKKVKTINLHQVIKIDEELSIQPFYAGHVLGAAMFLVRVGKLSVLYTGDYNMTPDRHLGPAKVSRCEPDLLITESTYATTIRDSKRVREREFLEKIHNTLLNNGKVLIPVFALGRAQELCILLESYWDRMNLSYPIYFSTGMTEKANEYYKLLITWTNQKIKETFVERNMFDFKHIKPLPQGMDYSSPDQPMVVFATPGMLHAGQSLQIFKKMAGCERNLVIIPGYCVAGTIGYKIQQGVKKLELDGGSGPGNKTVVDVRLGVEYLSFSAHADAKGIMQLVNMCQPRNVLLVHGEAHKMEFLKGRIEDEFKIRCFMPANGEEVTIHAEADRPYCRVKEELLQRLVAEQREDFSSYSGGRRRQRTHKFGLVMKTNERGQVELTAMEQQAALAKVGLIEQTFLFTSTVHFVSGHALAEIMAQLLVFLRSMFNPESGHEIHCQEERFSIGPLDDPLVRILVKESTGSVGGGAVCSGLTAGGYSATDGGDVQIFDVLKVTDKSSLLTAVSGQSSALATGGLDALQARREVSLHVTYSFQQEPMGAKLFQAIETACSERRLEFIV